ncbi:hypothetical protein DAT35_37595 [Vitiosangium sp. GDMCC 1.1324]|nr:hypothetical protein DAT35_37595 [Vitiosangium sp. GDMCC 1.1324]
MEEIIAQVNKGADDAEFLDSLEAALDREKASARRRWEHLSDSEDEDGDEDGVEYDEKERDAKEAGSARSAGRQPKQQEAKAARGRWEPGVGVECLRRFSHQELLRAVRMTSVEFGKIEGLCSILSLDWLHHMTRSTASAKSYNPDFARIGQKHFWYSKTYTRAMDVFKRGQDEAKMKHAEEDAKTDSKRPKKPEPGILKLELDRKATFERLGVFRRLYPGLWLNFPVELDRWFGPEDASDEKRKKAFIEDIDKIFRGAQDEKADQGTAAASRAPRVDDWACYVSMKLSNLSTKEEGNHAIALCRSGRHFYLMDQNFEILRTPAVAH